MGCIYEIECLACGHKKEVFEGIGMISQNTLYYCPECNEITTINEKWDYRNPEKKSQNTEHICKTCGTKLQQFEIVTNDNLTQTEQANCTSTQTDKSPNKSKNEILTSIPVKCQHCESENIKISEIGFWD